MSREALAAFLLLSTCIASPAQKKPVTIESITEVEPGKARPGAIAWAPDGKRFAYEQGGSIWLYDVPSKSRRELVALSALASTATQGAKPEAKEWKNRGVKEQKFQWSSSGESLLISAGGDLFLFRIQAGGWNRITSTPETERDPKLSPDGREVSFRRGHDLYSMAISSRKVTRLTHDGSDTLWNAKLDWVYPEELDLGTAHWWSADSKHIAYLQFDVSREPLYPHVDLLSPRALYEPQRYPKAGDPNPDVRLGVVSPEGGRTRWMDLGETRDSLLARVYWTPDGQSLLVKRLNRVQNRLDLLRANISNGAAKPILHEEDPYWININSESFGTGNDKDLPFLKDGKEFLWESERDGFRHLYRYSIEGRELAKLTGGEWAVTSVAGVDERNGQVYFVSTEQSALERHLYRVDLNGGERRRVTEGEGTHSISMDPACEYYLDTYSSLTAPAGRVIHSSDGKAWSVFEEADREPLEEYEILPTEIVKVKASDGALLYARLIRPAGFQPGKKYPAVVIVYGGPHIQAVRNSWKSPNWEQVLAHRGFVIWQLDNRGSAGRGHRWESAIFRNFGEKELEDQKEGIRHLISMGFTDAGRIGIYGWSFGGYMTLYSLLHAPELFRAGIAGAPVTDWRNYDTIYTERYMGLPAENEEGYRRSSPVHFAGNLQAKLLLIHNLEDDNVLFQNTLQMANALQQEDKQFDLMIYPLKAHGVSGQANNHMLELMTEFLERNLK